MHPLGETPLTAINVSFMLVVVLEIWLHAFIYFYLQKKDTTLVLRKALGLYIKYGVMHLLLTKLLNRWLPKTTFCNRRFENNNTTSF